ncbi:hypothetical protein WUBG_03729 [Wuchereria bancrofti]|uniref:Uncharacterized protein n=1 Tax=Wuchereria bancrofti TaxID=6293 RepID=J9FDB1_WUCBA|nr:hypothetical protein WUBG_03729 [Wuchereria bancrofti]
MFLLVLNIKFVQILVYLTLVFLSSMFQFRFLFNIITRRERFICFHISLIAFAVLCCMLV